METTTYRPTNAPVGTFDLAVDCAECGAESLKNPVWLENGNGPVAFGSGCAAVKMGWATDRDNAPSRAQFDRRYYRVLEERKRQVVRDELAARKEASANPTKETISKAKALRAEFKRLHGLD